MKSIEEYLDLLKTELKDTDAATMQDALADAEEHLRAALTNLREKQPALSEDEALSQVAEQYGSPEEIASAYKEVERLTRPVVRETQVQQGAIRRFLGVYDDPKAWGALLYMLISMITGIVYFTWVVTGLSLSLSFAIFVFGLLFAVFFTISLRGMALLEGRIIEGLLGVRMPRRSVFLQKDMTWFERLKANLTDKQVWLAMLYFFLQLPLGVIYFSVLVTLFALSLSFMAAPAVQSITTFPLMSIGDAHYYLPLWSMPLFLLLGFLIWTLTMHLGRWIGQWHGQYAKMLLVAE
ncbi:MAG: sensor domain-containing protein [Anaerolineales bacterium]